MSRIGGGYLVAAHRFRQAEVQHLKPAFRRELDVGGLEVAGDDTFIVRVLEGVDELMNNRQRLIQWQPASKRRPLHQFHDDGAIFHPVDRRDRRRMRRGQQRRLARKAREAVGSGAKGSGSTWIATSRFSLVSLARY